MKKKRPSVARVVIETTRRQFLDMACQCIRRTMETYSKGDPLWCEEEIQTLSNTLLTLSVIDESLSTRLRQAIEQD